MSDNYQAYIINIDSSNTDLNSLKQSLDSKISLFRESVFGKNNFKEIISHQNEMHDNQYQILLKQINDIVEKD